MKWYFIILIALAVGVVGLVIGMATSKQVVDAEGKPVKGKFLASTDGKSAVLQATK